MGGEGKHLSTEMEARSSRGMEGSPLGVEAVAADRAAPCWCPAPAPPLWGTSQVYGCREGHPEPGLRLPLPMLKRNLLLLPSCARASLDPSSASTGTHSGSCPSHFPKHREPNEAVPHFSPISYPWQAWAAPSSLSVLFLSHLLYPQPSSRSQQEEKDFVCPAVLQESLPWGTKLLDVPKPESATEKEQLKGLFQFGFFPPEERHGRNTAPPSP